MAAVDLNLMVIFDAIMQEQSITLAAQQLSMTQPSVSNAVSRMRYVWKDPLFVKQGRGIQPTPFAQTLWANINEHLSAIRLATEPNNFDINKVERTFRIAVTDWMADLFWLPLRKIIEQHAPNIRIHAVPYSVNGESLLNNADVDLVLDYYEGESSMVQSQHLFDNHFVCAMRPEHPLANEELTISKFVGAEHLLLSLSGEALGGVDTLLKNQGLSRNISMTVNHCYQIANLVGQSNLITTIPLPLISEAVSQGRLIITKPPFDLDPGPISMTWHNRHQRDSGILWLREQILSIVQTEKHQHLRVKPFMK